MTVLRSISLFTIAAAIAGCSANEPPSATNEPVASTTPAIALATTVECSNVERAYKAWLWEPTSSADWSKFQIEMHMDDGEAFHDEIEGYDDAPALELVLAVAKYNYELALVNGQMLINGGADTGAAEEAHTDVIKAYGEFQRLTCP